jgi:dihydroorotase
VTCSVTPYHLFFSDDDLLNYDTNLKVYPPLRPKEVVKALRSAVADGTIDCIATHHLPHEYDSKVLEFEYAKFGMTGLETTYAVLQASVPELSQEQWIELLSTNPRKIFNLPIPLLETGAKTCLTLFDPSASWNYSGSRVRSKSKNSPFLEKEMKGKAFGIINGEKLFLNT